LVWLKIGASGGHLWTRSWIFGFHEILGNSWVVEGLAASQEGLRFMGIVFSFPSSAISNLKCRQAWTVWTYTQHEW
jgi:hypothetical protein